MGVENMHLVPGTYYIVASSTDDNFTVDINVEPVPVPEMAYEPNPANGQGGVSTPVTLTWKLGEYASEYQLLMGTVYPPSEVLVDWTGDLAESYSTGTLLNNKNYFWQVNARNSAGTTTGEVWGFTTTLNIPQDLVAADYELYEGEAAELSWTGKDQ